jgi:hypothetical protein
MKGNKKTTSSSFYRGLQRPLYHEDLKNSNDPTKAVNVFFNSSKDNQNHTITQFQTKLQTQMHGVPRLNQPESR